MTVKSNRSPTEIDAEIGGLVRLARKHAKLSQTELGQALGVTYQQVQKYENGTDRVAVSRLVQMANFLEIPVGRLIPGVAEGDEKVGGLSMEETTLLAAFRRVKSPALRKTAIETLKTFSHL